MATQGVFGYVLGKKKRFMHVQYDAHMLYSILVRELYVLLKHYGNDIEQLKNAFDNIKNANGLPTKQIMDKTKYYSNFDVSSKSLYDWYCLLRGCQHSFINILDCGYILNCHDEYGYVFTLNFNSNRITFRNSNKILNDHDIFDILKMENMPQISYDEIINETRLDYNIKKERLEELTKLINGIIIEYPTIDKLNLTKKLFVSTDPTTIKLVETKIQYDEYKHEFRNLINTDFNYGFNKRLKQLLL